MMAAQEPVAMEEAIIEGAAAFVLGCAGMIITTIVTHFVLLKSVNNGNKAGSFLPKISGLIIALCE